MGGKRHSTRLSKGPPWLKTTLVQAAWRATYTKNSYLWVQFLRSADRSPEGHLGFQVDLWDAA